MFYLASQTVLFLLDFKVGSRHRRENRCRLGHGLGVAWPDKDAPPCLPCCGRLGSPPLIFPWTAQRLSYSWSTYVFGLGFHWYKAPQQTLEPNSRILPTPSSNQSRQPAQNTRPSVCLFLKRRLEYTHRAPAALERTLTRRKSNHISRGGSICTDFWVSQSSGTILDCTIQGCRQ